MNLNQIQKELKAPKGKTNTFGNYKYRSCEDILEAVKPLLGDSVLLLSDDIVQVGERYYIQATARFIDGENITSVNGFARESETKKGMDDSQITGTASSYARKYALNGLFLIDDTKDADSNEFMKALKKGATKAEEFEEDETFDEPISPVMTTRITEIIKLNKTDKEALALGTEFCKEFKIKHVKELLNRDYPQAVKWLEGK